LAGSARLLRHPLLFEGGVNASFFPTGFIRE
jgi:hypothetical protein